MVLPWEFHASWELWESLKCCRISLLAVSCPGDSNPLVRTGEEEMGTQLCSTQQCFGSCSGTDMDEQRDNSRKGQAEDSHPCRPVSLIPSEDLGQTPLAEESEGRSTPTRAARVLTSCPVCPLRGSCSLIKAGSHPLPATAPMCHCLQQLWGCEPRLSRAQ